MPRLPVVSIHPETPDIPAVHVVAAVQQAEQVADGLNGGFLAGSKLVCLAVRGHVAQRRSEAQCAGGSIILMCLPKLREW